MLRRRLRRTWPQRLLLGFGMLTTLALLLSAAGLSYGLNRYKSITFVKVPELNPSTPGKPTNWLLVGSDSRDGIDPDDPNAGAFLGEKVGGKRTDTIILARVNPADKTVDLLSIPRDLWVPLAGTNQRGRINSAFNGDGGEQRLIQTVQNVLHVEVNHYAEINFVGFRSIIDAVGGVPVYFETPVRDDNSGLNIKAPGCQTLNGTDAVAFVRSRHLEYFQNNKWHDDPTGDLGRTARQQYLLSRLADIAKQQLDLTNILTVNRLLDVTGRNLVFDDGASPSKLFDLGRTFAGVGSEGIRRHALAVTPRVTDGGADVLDLNEDDSEDTLNIFRENPIESRKPPTAETVARNSFLVDVANGSTQTKLGAKTSTDLKTAGFTVGTVADAKAPSTKTIIRYPAKAAAAANTLGLSLTAAPRYQLDNTITNVQLLLGNDFKGVNTKPSATTTTAPPATTPDTEPEPVGVVPKPGPPGTACAVPA